MNKILVVDRVCWRGNQPCDGVSLGCRLWMVVAVFLVENSFFEGLLERSRVEWLLSYRSCYCLYIFIRLEWLVACGVAEIHFVMRQPASFAFGDRKTEKQASKDRKIQIRAVVLPSISVSVIVGIRIRNHW